MMTRKNLRQFALLFFLLSSIAYLADTPFLIVSLIMMNLVVITVVTLSPYGIVGKIINSIRASLTYVILATAYLIFIMPFSLIAMTRSSVFKFKKTSPSTSYRILNEQDHKSSLERMY